MLPYHQASGASLHPAKEALNLRTLLHLVCAFLVVAFHFRTRWAILEQITIISVASMNPSTKTEVLAA